jgi:E3 ubiquitin-protein ligase UHRF1
MALGPSPSLVDTPTSKSSHQSCNMKVPGMLLIPSVDLGVAFTYTGCGGRDLKGTAQNPKNLRTAEQTSDQSFDWPLNAAIKRSAETKKPVRVIRGYKLPSPYAPVEGYRYDGLYIVEKAWMGKGLTKGLKVCRYAFKRVEGQPDLPVRDLDKELEDLEAE